MGLATRIQRLPQPVKLVGGGILGALLLVGLFLFRPREGGILREGKLSEPEQLAREARAALATIPTEENRRNRRPVGFDDVLRPVDDLIRHARLELDAGRDSESVHPPTALSRMEAVRHYAQAANIGTEAADLAGQGLVLARAAARTQRFPDQIADAMQAAAMAQLLRLRLEWDHPDRPPPALLVGPLEKSLAAGLEHRPNDRELLFISASLDQRLGRWPAAGKSLQTAVDTHPDFAEGWNDLGLVRIMLRDNAGAEQAFREAMRLAEPKPGDPPNPTYQSAAYNLAAFFIAQARFHRDAFNRTGDPAERQSADQYRQWAVQASADFQRNAGPEEVTRSRNELARIGAGGN